MDETTSQLRGSDQMHSRQSTMQWESKIQGSMPNYGQNLGGKHATKSRSVRPDTGPELQEMVDRKEQHEVNKNSLVSGLQQMTALAGALAPTEYDDLDSGAESVGSETGSQVLAASTTPFAFVTLVKAKSVAGVAFCSSKPAACSLAPSGCSLRKASVVGRLGGEVALMSSPSLKHSSSFRESVDDGASVATIDGEGKTRVKSATYWLQIITIAGGFSGKKYTREAVWAQECITREIRAGKGTTNPEVLCNTTKSNKLKVQT